MSFDPFGKLPMALVVTAFVAIALEQWTVSLVFLAAWFGVFFAASDFGGEVEA